MRGLVLFLGVITYRCVGAARESNHVSSSTNVDGEVLQRVSRRHILEKDARHQLISNLGRKGASRYTRTAFLKMKVLDAA
jgi:hypothetical protein